MSPSSSVQLQRDRGKRKEKTSQAGIYARQKKITSFYKRNHRLCNESLKVHRNDRVCHSFFYVYVKWIFFWAASLMPLIYQICKWPVPTAVLWCSFEPGSGELERWLALFPGKTALMIRMTGAGPGQITTKISASAASQPWPGLYHWLYRLAHGLTKYVAGWLVWCVAGWLTNQLTGWLFGFICDWLDGWPTGRLCSWKADCFLACWLTGCFWMVTQVVKFSQRWRPS